MTSLDKMRERYIRLQPSETTSLQELDRIEKILGIKLPKDFRSIASFYTGGFLGGISHNAISCEGPGYNVVEETLRLRASVNLPNRYLVLAEPPESLIVLDTSKKTSADSPTVLWCDATDVSRLDDPSLLTNPDTWISYSAFFSYMLSEEEEENRQSA